VIGSSIVLEHIASLIGLAEKTGVVQIATIDQGDFSVFRVRGRDRFRIPIGSQPGAQVLASVK